MNAILALVLSAALYAFPPATAGPSHPEARAALLGDALVAALDSGQVDPLVMKNLEFERQPITDEVAHYSLTLPVGSGAFEEIRLHRVVRESRPWVPVRTSRAIFLAHGDAWGFEATFLTSLSAPEIPDRQALPVILAENDVDVWGIDFRWSLVPEDVSDLSFMADWGLGTNVDDLDTALAVARAVRLVTSGSFSKFVLLGWSRGTQIGYALLSAETQRPRALRHVRGFVAMDVEFKTDDETHRQAACASYASLEALIAAGNYASGYAVVADFGDLASAAPEDPSPFFPIVSNADFAELVGAEPNPNGTIPHFHSVGGVIDPATYETDLLYTQSEHWFAFLSGVSPYQPLKINLEGSALLCDEIDVPYDDHLAEVDVPVFYVGAAGAYGSFGLYTTTLLGSSDVSSLIVNEAAQPELDYGHSDLLLADGAEALVWTPILNWITSR